MPFLPPSQQRQSTERASGDRRNKEKEVKGGKEGRKVEREGREEEGRGKGKRRKGRDREKICAVGISH